MEKLMNEMMQNFNCCISLYKLSITEKTSSAWKHYQMKKLKSQTHTLRSQLNNTANGGWKNFEATEAETVTNNLKTIQTFWTTEKK